MRLIKFVTLTIVSACLGSLIACKEGSIVDTDILSDEDLISVNTLPDTITFETKTTFFDSVITGGPTASSFYMGIGRISNDVDFGTTLSTLFLQVNAPNTSYTFDVNNNFYDSLVLVLPYSGFVYGDTSNGAAPLTYNVYRLIGSMATSDTLYSCSPAIPSDNDVLGSVTVEPQNLSQLAKDSLMINGIKVPYHLRIKLKPELLNTLINRMNDAPFGDQAAFVDWFKGFEIRLADTNAAVNTIPYWLLSKGTDVRYTRAAMLVYYRAKDSSAVKIDEFPFSTAYCTAFNKITKNPSGSKLATLLSSTNVSDEEIAIQALPGAVMEVNFPYISGLPKGAINKAEFIFTEIASTHNATFAAPTYIFPVGIKANGEKYVVLDRESSSGNADDAGLNFVDGARKSVTIGGITVHQYKVNLPRTLQNAIATGETSLKIQFYGAGGIPGANRVIVAGRTHPNSDVKLKMNIVYSHLSNN
jgi:hypothetical protein